MPAFNRYIGIDYSGAQTPNASLKGLRVYMAEGDGPPAEVLPPPSPQKYWSRRGVAEWLMDRLNEDAPTLVGIDHGFSFPLSYFQAHGLPRDWDSFLEDFQNHWPTDDDIRVDDVRDGAFGNGAARGGNTRWKRLTERRAGAAKSVFHFDVQGSVAKSSHSGIPWLRFIRRKLGQQVHFWPFDGWEVPEGRSAIAEVYPALWNRDLENDGRNPDQHDAFCIAAWMSRADRDGELARSLQPALSDEESAIAMAEGWILGVTGATSTRRPISPDERLTAEKVAYWYFRLNGFLQIENFVIHPPGRGGQRTDADLLAVRFPNRAERLFDNPDDVMVDDVRALALSPDQIDMAIVEVKTGQPCALNGPWTDRDRQNVERVLAALGCLALDRIPIAAADLYEKGMHQADGLRVRLIAIGNGRSLDLTKQYPSVKQITWSDALGFIWQRFHAYRRQKAQVDQWDTTGRRLKQLADGCRGEPEFVEGAKARMGILHLAIGADD
ncbi:hypothetical protein [Phenylobacterium sp.]|uniref:hypothetical protein n=1 Tax=Phenylobacterium sp. TaxID=1871053 RepID=UPI0025F5BDEF|nr:hypothetical protein [Phenylobacterium sp.]